MVFDGGAYASSSTAVVANASYFSVGPYRCDNVFVESHVTRTNNPPCGAMRGFGAVQACFGYEAQMDRARRARWGWTRSSCGCATPSPPGIAMPTTGQVIRGITADRPGDRGVAGDAVATGCRARPMRSTCPVEPGSPPTRVTCGVAWGTRSA